ncbi:MAG: hypothetical protein QXI93_03210 [Candidatus Methanomethylicia archaeon]
MIIVFISVSYIQANGLINPSKYAKRYENILIINNKLSISPTLNLFFKNTYIYNGYSTIIFDPTYIIINKARYAKRLEKNMDIRK